MDGPSINRAEYYVGRLGSMCWAAGWTRGGYVYLAIDKLQGLTEKAVARTDID
jgi:hypothetical protein